RAVHDSQRARDAAFDAQRIGAVAAVDRKGNVVALLDADAGRDLVILERLDHRGFARVGERAVIFAQMAPEAPFFIDINSFHLMTPNLSYPEVGRRDLPRASAHQIGFCLAKSIKSAGL